MSESAKDIIIRAWEKNKGKIAWTTAEYYVTGPIDGVGGDGSDNISTLVVKFRRVHNPSKNCDVILGSMGSTEVVVEDNINHKGYWR
jgi:hypothetical protein